jgi:hypothetical protein
MIPPSANTDGDRWRKETLEPHLERSPERKPGFETSSGHPIEPCYTADSISDSGVGFRPSR